MQTPPNNGKLLYMELTNKQTKKGHSMEMKQVANCYVDCDYKFVDGKAGVILSVYDGGSPSKLVAHLTNDQARELMVELVAAFGTATKSNL